MDIRLKNYLASKGVIVSEGSQLPDAEEIIPSLVTMRQFFGVRINKGKHLASKNTLKTLEEQIAKNLPRAFYKDFPESVLRLSREQIILDQAIHYLRTYGFGDFSEGKYSIFEEENPISDLLRAGEINESVEKIFDILTEDEAFEKLKECAEDMLAGSRPLSESQFEVLCILLNTTDFRVNNKTSKNTAIRLTVESIKSIYKESTLFSKTSLKDPKQFWGSLVLSDGIKLLENILLNVSRCKKKIYDPLKKYSLPNKVRKVLTQFIKEKATNANMSQLSECSEKMKLWASLLHHIHFVAETKGEKIFVNGMRKGENFSVPSAIDRYLKKGRIKEAIQEAKVGKGSTYLLRNISRLIQECKTDAEKIDVINSAIEGASSMSLYQNYIFFSTYPETKDQRTFRFVKNNKLCVAVESYKSVQKRKTFLERDVRDIILESLNNEIIKRNNDNDISSEFGKIYIDPEMKKIALPIQEATGSTGVGVKTRGSRIPITIKNPRFFTSWKDVNDIDLAAFVMFEDPKKRCLECSWRTNGNHDNRWIRFSGDITNGMKGATEYLDLDIDMLKSVHPDSTHVILTDNVFSSSSFDQCTCYAGFMQRENFSSGLVYEPKTVEASFLINAKVRFAYLFAIDLETREIVWLNLGMNENSPVAGDANIDAIKGYLNLTDILNVYDLISTSSTQIVDDPAMADTIISDKIFADIDPDNNKRYIKSGDIEIFAKIMEHKLVKKD